MNSQLCNLDASSGVETIPERVRPINMTTTASPRNPLGSATPARVPINPYVVSPPPLAGTSDQVNLTDDSLAMKVPAYSGSTVLSLDAALTCHPEMINTHTDAPGDGPCQIEAPQVSLGWKRKVNF